MFSYDHHSKQGKGPSRACAGHHCTTTQAASSSSPRPKLTTHRQTASTMNHYKPCVLQCNEQLRLLAQCDIGAMAVTGAPAMRLCPKRPQNSANSNPSAVCTFTTGANTASNRRLTPVRGVPWPRRQGQVCVSSQTHSSNQANMSRRCSGRQSTWVFQGCSHFPRHTRCEMHTELHQR
jgi:hypothetical protein